MTMFEKWILSLAATLVLTSNGVAAAAAEDAAEPFLPAWNHFVDELRDLAPMMLAKLPEDLRDDPQTRQEVGRLLLEALASGSLEAIAPQGDHPMFVPYINLVFNIGQPNADTVYKKATITPGGSYRLRGSAGSLRIATIGMFGSLGLDSGAIRALGYFDLGTLMTDASGNFEVLLSASRPQGYEGNWWQLDPRANKLLLRQVASDWATERDPAIAIERLDAPATRPRPAARDVAQQLAITSEKTTFNALLLLDHVESLRAEGFVNRFKPWDVTASYGGLVGQFYYESVYQLEGEEALIIETDVPENCRYASLLLTNHIFETTDWYNNQSSLNDSQWHVNADGKLRVVVSATDPGVQNWLDIAGYPRGIIQGRWTECDSTPLPSVRKLGVGEIVAQLPSDTPRVSLAEREKNIRERRVQFQLRRLW